MGAFCSGGRENTVEAKKRTRRKTHILLPCPVVQGMGCIGRCVIRKMREEVKDNIICWLGTVSVLALGMLGRQNKACA